MPFQTNRVVAKKATNVSVRTDLLEEARACGLNLSATLERALIEEIKHSQRRKWREENQEAIALYNEQVAKGGVFSDGDRSF